MNDEERLELLKEDRENLIIELEQVKREIAKIEAAIWERDERRPKSIDDLRRLMETEKVAKVRRDGDREPP